MPSAVAMLPPVECTVHNLYPDSTDLPAGLIPLRRFGQPFIHHNHL